ncbi:MAG: hypothetical protein ACD_62C00452G0001 [uncultured bacterium]|nr:MAG: hypothetical protein ACD_62C00452G0001 [uncultured bacterium]
MTFLSFPKVAGQKMNAVFDAQTNEDDHERDGDEVQLPKEETGETCCPGHTDHQRQEGKKGASQFTEPCKNEQCDQKKRTDPCQQAVNLSAVGLVVL